MRNERIRIRTWRHSDQREVGMYKGMKVTCIGLVQVFSSFILSEFNGTLIASVYTALITPLRMALLFLRLF